MSLEHFAVPESKEVLKKQKDEGSSERHRGQWTKLEQMEQQNGQGSLDYNPKNKNIYEFIVIK